MKFKEFMTTVGYLPATAFSGLANLVLGSTKKNRDGETQLDVNDKPVTNRGILGYALDGVKYVARSTADFIAEHKKAISVAAWLSLAAAGGVALTLFLWPAALTAVATFSIYGFSIAGIVGANTALQIGFAAGLAATAASVGTYLTAALANTFSAVAGYFKRPSKKQELSSESSNDEDISDDHSHDKVNPLSLLNSQEKKKSSTEEIHVEPKQTKLFSSSVPQSTVVDQTVEHKTNLSC